MTFARSLKRGAAIATTLGLVGIGSLLVASPATAADQGDRLEGALVLTAPSNEALSTVAVLNSAVLGEQPTVVSVASAELLAPIIATAPIYSVPAPGTVGPIMSNEMCLDYRARLQQCNGTGAQNFSWVAGGLRTIATSQWLGFETGTVTLGDGRFFAEVVDAAPVAPHIPFAVTSPEGTPEVSDGEVQFTGTATPGDTVTVTNADGDVIAVATADAEGNWAMMVPVANGYQEVTVTARDEAVTVALVGVDSVDGTPVIHPALALGGLVAVGAAGLGITAKRRREGSAAA